MKVFVSTITAVTANIGCSIFPRGDIIGAGGEQFSDIYQYQPLNFKKCTNPVVDGRFAEGTTCGEISCYGKNSHVKVKDSQCICSADGLSCDWVNQENNAESAIPKCPKGCKGNDIFEMARCRKNYMWGDSKYTDNSGIQYFYPGERCKKVNCSGGRQPKYMQGDQLAAWKSVASSFYECVCHGDQCKWTGLNDDVVEGTAFNAGIPLKCAEWTAWTDVGPCVFHKQARVRDCLVDETFYVKKDGYVKDSRRGIAGYDCPGMPKEKVAC